jgi:hypothetical protein
MTLFYKRLSPALATDDWASLVPPTNPETPWMRVSPGRKIGAESVQLKGGVMANDDRDVLQVLESELDFLTKHGYERSVRTPREPTILFQDSPICPEFPCRMHNDQCLLMQFVPEAERLSAVPCHHIPLNEKGDTVESLLAEENREHAEEALKAWLRRAIDHVRQERGGRVIPIS